MKKCIKCNLEKHEIEFYKRENGFLRNECKVCVKVQVNKNYNINKNDKEFIDKERKRGREKYKRLYKTSLFNRYQLYCDGETHKTRFPEKHYAANATKGKVRKIGYDAHHWSYFKNHWLDVIYLTKKEHMSLHRYIIYDQERMMYRRTDTNELLDTKELHLEYYHSLKNKN